MFNRFSQLAIIVPLIAGALALSACATTPTPTAAPTTSPTPTPTSTSSATQSVAAAKQELVLRVAAKANLGNILTDAQGMTLYIYKNDTPDQSKCTGDCAKNWLPLMVAQGVTPIADKTITGNLSLIPRGDSTYQVAYNDMPLYRYSGDQKPGDINGNGLQGLWSVVILPSPASTIAPTSNTIDWTTHGFPNILATQMITPTYAAIFSTGPYTIFIPANTFTVPVKFVVLSGAPASFQTKTPPHETPVLAFAFNVHDASTDALITQFDQAVLVTAQSDAILGDSGYYNISPNGDEVLNLSGIQEQVGELTHPITGTNMGWVITAPSLLSVPSTPPH